MKNNIFKETRNKIVITSNVIVLFSLFVFSIIIALFYRVNLYQQIDRDLTNQIEMLEKIKQGDDITIQIPFQTQMPNTVLPHMTNPKMILIIYENNHTIYQSPNRYFEEGQNLNISKDSGNKIVDFSYKNYSFRCRSIDFNGVQLILLSNTDSERISYTRLINIILFSFILLLALSIYLSMLLASKVLKPIKKSYNDQVQFVQNASHEMRTPLAVIKGKLELLAMQPNETFEENFEQFSAIMSEVYSLERLTKDLLILSKEDVDADLVKINFNLTEMINEFSEFYGAIAESQNKYFFIDMTNIVNLTINQDYYRFKQSIVILIENAFKYTNESDTITAHFEQHDKYLYIKITDTGIGIKDKDKELIFERFFRSDDVRGKNIDGNGIGLSLLKSLSKSLGFKIHMCSVYGQGTEFTLIYKIK